MGSSSSPEGNSSEGWRGLLLNWRLAVLVELKEPYSVDGYLMWMKVCGLALTKRNIFSRDLLNVKIRSFSLFQNQVIAVASSFLVNITKIP